MFQEKSLMTEQEILSRLVQEKGIYSPLEIVSVKKSEKSRCGFDVKVTVGWRQYKVDFKTEIKARTSPKLIDESLRQLGSDRGRQKQDCLLIVPFLSKTIVEILEREGLSGLDLNGNYLIQSREMMAIRLDRKNQFRESQTIKKIFSGNSSLVSRLFLSGRKRFESVNEIYSAIQALGGSLSLSAISKVLKGLENELIIEKNKDAISLLQPDKLLLHLKEDYRPPKVLATMRLKLPALNSVRIFDKILPPATRWVLSGESSADRYAVTTPIEVVTIYVTDFASLASYQEERFYNVILKKTFDLFPYFDTREHDHLRYSSPVQCYLELSRLDKREQELASSVREAILDNLK